MISSVLRAGAAAENQASKLSASPRHPRGGSGDLVEVPETSTVGRSPSGLFSWSMWASGDAVALSFPRSGLFERLWHRLGAKDASSSSVPGTGRPAICLRVCARRHVGQLPFSVSCWSTTRVPEHASTLVGCYYAPAEVPTAVCLFPLPASRCGVFVGHSAAAVSGAGDADLARPRPLGNPYVRRLGARACRTRASSQRRRYAGTRRRGPLHAPTYQASGWSCEGFKDGCLAAAPDRGFVLDHRRLLRLFAVGHEFDTAMTTANARAYPLPWKTSLVSLRRTDIGTAVGKTSRPSTRARCRPSVRPLRPWRRILPPASALPSNPLAARAHSPRFDYTGDDQQRAEGSPGRGLDPKLLTAG